MEGKIDKNGILMVKRGEREQQQQCPFAVIPHDPWKYCGDWCPLFGEPTLHKGDTEDGGKWQYTELNICRKIWMFDKFTDERAK